VDYFTNQEREAAAELRDERQQKRERFMPATDAEILASIGWGRTDRRFLSLNLTDEQFEAIQACQNATEPESLEQMISDACVAFHVSLELRSMARRVAERCGKPVDVDEWARRLANDISNQE
jgi:hypothetical protein